MALDVAVSANAYDPCTTDCTITGITTNSNGAAVIAWWIADNTTTFTLQTAGWTQDQSRILNTAGQDNTQSYAWRIPVNSTGSGDVTNEQGSSRAGVEYIFALKAADARKRIITIFVD